MNYTLLVVRCCFLAICIFASWLLTLAIPDWQRMLPRVIFIGASIGILVILVDIFLKGFSLRGLSAATFGLFVGWLAAFFLSNSPLFEAGDEEILYLARIVLYIVVTYLSTVIALRGKDEFNLVIPYMRFVPHGVDVPLAVVDTSALIDGRILGICASRFMGYALVIPRFVLDELQNIADSSDPIRQAKGRKGLDVLNELRRIDYLDIRIHDSDVDKRQNVDAKLIYLAQSLKAKLLTTDFNLARMAEFHGLEWLNLSALAKAMNPDLVVGEVIEVDLVKAGKERGQAVGFLPDGSMVVINQGKEYLGKRVVAEVQSILPSAGGKMIFADVTKARDIPKTASNRDDSETIHN